MTNMNIKKLLVPALVAGACAAAIAVPAFGSTTCAQDAVSAHEQDFCTSRNLVFSITPTPSLATPTGLNSTLSLIKNAKGIDTIGLTANQVKIGGCEVINRVVGSTKSTPVGKCPNLGFYRTFVQIN